MYQHILVPVDDSELAVSLVAQAVAFARTQSARITFLHVRADLAATSDGAVMLALAPAAFDAQATGNALGVLARAEAEARLAGVMFDACVRTSDRPYEAILDVAETGGCDLIFMASHGRRGVRGLLLGSQTSKVLAHTRLPVLVATVEANVECPQMQAAVAIIKGEHRSIAAVMHGLKHAIGLAQQGGKLVEPALLRGAVRYFRDFTAALHHPKEDLYLFERLRERTPTSHGMLAALEQQHHEEGRHVEALMLAADAYLADPDAASLSALAQATDAYAEHLWDHMSREEKLLLPACQAHFDRDDWRAIVQAFEANGDPRFDRERVQGFERLFVSLVAFESPGHRRTF